MPIIEVMSELLSNKIAAGEVVERPFSVVKELVENSIDAGSSVIDILVEEGGLARIQVVDNGQGMDRQDSRMAFERHATSKLKADQDLFRIATLGFRGEALPSIAAVAKISLQTWNGTDPVGTKIMIHGGQVVDIEDAPLRQGTIIEVTDLFYNTPARYKYLKTIHTELSHISDYVNRMAMAHPSISFRLKHHDRELLATNGNGQLISVISAIYGVSTAKQMIPFEATHIDFSTQGLIGKPELNRSSRQHISLFLNGRYVRSHMINQAIIAAYHTLLPVHRYPVVALSIQMDPSLLDINVHPAKLEVRLSKEQELMNWLEQEIRKVLQKTSLIPQPLSTSRPTKAQVIQQSLHLQLPDRQQQRPSPDSQQQKPLPSIQPQAADQPNGIPLNRAAEAREGYKGHFSQAKRELQGDSNHSAKEVDSQPFDDVKIPLLYPLGQLHGTYILAQNDKGLYMIDQHAAQERIWYEYYRQQLNHPVQANQELLLPIVLEFTAAEAQLIKQNLEELSRLGLFLEEFGHHSYMIRSHPQWFPQGEEESLMREMVQQLIEQKGKVEWITFRDEVAKMMACKQSIKANQYLTRGEMEALLEKLRVTTNPFTCPHGRPITILITKYDIEKMFKRVM